jgi:peptidylamidoglycolate lyase
MTHRFTVALAVAVSLGGALVTSQEKGGGDETGEYEVVPGWPQNYCGQGHVIGATGGILAENPNRIIIFSRGCLPVIEDTRGPAENFIPIRNAANFDLAQADASRHPRWDHIVNIVDRNGRLIESWEQHNARFVRPHRVLMNPYDAERHIWLVDDGAHSIYKFTNDGKTLVMSLGEFKVPGNDARHFARPTDIVWLPDGTFFVSDGYTNTRVVKFDRTGKYLMHWGEKGVEPNETRPGYMNTVHALAIDKNRRIYVSDRANARIQVFDENGKFLDVWTKVRRPYSFLMSADQHLWVSDGTTQKMLKFDLTGRLLHAWGTFGQFPGGFWGVHQFSVDSEGNLYTADVHVGRSQKFRPKPGADKSKLIGAPMRAN